MSIDPMSPSPATLAALEPKALATPLGRLVADLLPEIVYILDPMGKVLFTNRSWSTYTGLTPEATLGDGWRTTFPADDEHRVLESFREAMANKRPFEAEFRLRRHDGVFRWHMCRILPVFDIDGRTHAWVGTTIDIHERKELAEERERDKATLRRQSMVSSSVFENMAEGLIVADAEGRFVHFNPEARRILGDPIASGRPDRWAKAYTLFLSDGRTPCPADSVPLARAIRGDSVNGFVMLVRPRERSRRWVSVNARPLRDESGRITGGLAVFHDITHQRAAEEELRRLYQRLEARVASRTRQLIATNAALRREIAHRLHATELLKSNEARFRSVAETASETIALITSGGRIRYVNPAAERLFGWTKTEAGGRSLSRFVSHDSAASLRRVLRSPERSVRIELTGRRRNRTTFPVYLYLSAPWKHEKDFLRTAVFRDLTERKRMEGLMLEISERERSRVARDLHDGLGQHLTAIAYTARLLEERVSRGAADAQADAKRLVSQIEGAMVQMRGLARGLYAADLARAELKAALQELAATVQKTYGTRCVFRAGPRTDPANESVATHLYWIAGEAVRNAVRHGKPKRIDIRLARRNALVLTVSDDGAGLPKRLHRSGMGFLIMKQRAEIIGAVLSIVRAPRRGTVVQCVVPDASVRSARVKERP